MTEQFVVAHQIAIVAKQSRITATGSVNASMAAGGQETDPAIAVARRGRDVTRIAKIGPDLFGDQSRRRIAPTS